MWHLLSLDAPSVAALWTYFLARSVNVHLPWFAIAAMFVAVWMIYAADRLLDAKALDFADAGTSIDVLEERHHFHHRHRRSFLGWLCAAAVLLIFLLPRLSPEALLRYCLLATLLGAWMLIIHARTHQGSSSARLPKELVVGIFFPAAVFIPTIVRVPALQLTLLPAAILFAGVCTLNCLYVYAWEHPLQAPARTQAHWTTLYAVRRLRWFAATIAGLGLFLGLRSSPIQLPCVACATSCLLLLLLNATRRRMSTVHLRASADLVLLTPMLLLPFLPR